jgi:mono/diheme cytochrome c family protein
MINSHKFTKVIAPFALGAAALLFVSPANSASPVTAANKALFKSNCGSCHVLKAAGTHGAVGPNLDTNKDSLGKIIGQVTNGGRFMPPFVKTRGGKLTPAQIKTVAAYVIAVRGKKK